MMISTVNTDVIESILNRKLKFDDFNFKPLSWQDAFIVKLLEWFDKKIETISERKCKDTFDKELIDNWRLYYEQIVRILYHFVIYKNIHDCKQLNKIFSYLFNVDKNVSPYKNNYDMISSEKLMKVYRYIRSFIYRWRLDNKDREYINVLIGIWNNENMNYKLDNVITFITDDKKTSVYINVDSSFFKEKHNNCKFNLFVNDKKVNIEDDDYNKKLNKFMKILTKIIEKNKEKNDCDFDLIINNKKVHLEYDGYIEILNKIREELTKMTE